MFRSKKKKIHAGSRRVVRTSNDDDADDGQNNDADHVGTNGVPPDEDEVDEPPSALLIALQKRKTEKRDKKRTKTKRKIGSGGGGPVVRSFDIEEADDDGDGDDDQNKRKKSKKKKRKRGLGFGGGGDNDNNMMDCDNNDDEIDDEMGSRTINTYGKEALEKLKSEQKLQTVPQREPLHSATSLNTDSLKNGESKIISNPPEESFISLNDLGEGNDTGSENYGRKMEQEKEKIFVVDDPLPDESHGWERQIEQRAGIKASSMSSQPSTNNNITNSKLLSLDELSQKLQSTIETIDRQKEELQNSTNRLRADRTHAMTNSKDHQKNLRNTGLACEFYQSTRRDLTLWVGALRDLQEKVSPIAAAFREMLRIQTRDFGHEFRAWQDDCVATLFQTNRLDRVLGRQPESTLLSRASNEIVIDEFGRDVRSQYLRDRELRFKDRMEYIHRNDNGAIIKHEDHDEEERSKILQEALSAALEDLDQKYTSVAQLKSIFDGWFAAYVDDYQQCFATLSFGDLYAVLVQVELCKSNLFPDVLSSLNRPTSQEPILEIDHCFSDPSNDQEKEEEKYIAKNKTSKVTIENAGRLARVVEKGILPVLVKILNNDEDGGNDDDSFYLFFSSLKSSLISKLINDVAIRPLQHEQNGSNSKSLNSDLRQQLQNLVSIAIKNALGGISIPLLNKGNNSGGDDGGGNNGSSLAFRFANVYLVQILQQALCNIIIYWFPLIDIDTNSNSSSDGQTETGIHYVLNFINEKYLVLLSSIKNAEDATTASSSSSSDPSLSSAKAFFKPVWEALNNTNTESRRNIIESPSLMLSTLPLRAAARAYELN